MVVSVAHHLDFSFGRSHFCEKCDHSSQSHTAVMIITAATAAAAAIVVTTALCVVALYLNPFRLMDIAE
jgi:hypothetical protein